MKPPVITAIACGVEKMGPHVPYWVRLPGFPILLAVLTAALAVDVALIIVFGTLWSMTFGFGKIRREFSQPLLDAAAARGGLWGDQP